MFEYLPQAITSLSAAGNIAKTLVGLRDENLLNSKVIDLQRCIIEAQQQVLSGQFEQTATTKKIEELEAEIARLKDWSSERENYVLTQIAHSVFTYVPKDFTGPYWEARKLCCNCFEKGIKSTLQNNLPATGRNVHLVCPNRCPELVFRHFSEQRTSQ